MLSEKELKEKYPAVAALSTDEQNKLFAMMEAFQDAAVKTVKGGEELLKMCDGCAFKRETEANNQPFTALIAIQCILTEETFFCHKRFGIGGKEKVCNGWINVMNNI